MKAFAFRLEQALRWRETQVSLQKSRTAAAALRLAEIEKLLEAMHKELSAAAARLVNSPTGAALSSFAGFRKRVQERIRNFEGQTVAAKNALAVERSRLVEASQKLRAIENLKRTAQGRWSREFDRELAAFADEAFLARLHQRS